MLHTIAQIDSGARDRCVKPGHRLDLSSGYTTDEFSPLRRILSNMGLQTSESMAPLFHKGMVNQVLADHYMQHGQG